MLKNVSGQIIGAQMVSATDGSAFTGSVTVHVTGDGGTQATGSVGSGACTHEGNGFHTYAPAQAETNYNHVAFTFTGTGAIPVTVQIYTLPTTGVLAPTTAGRTLTVESDGMAHADVKEIEGSDATDQIRDSIVDDATRIDASALNTATGTTIPAILEDTGTTLPGTLATIDGIVDDILLDTAEIGAAGAGLTEAGGTGDHLTALPWNADWDPEVQSEVEDGLVAYGTATGTDVATAAANVSVDEIQATALADLFNTDSATSYASAVAGSVVKEIADNAGGSSLTEAGIAETVAEYMFSHDTSLNYAGADANSVVKQIADNAGGSSLTAADIADEVETRTLLANVTQISGDSGAADNLEAAFDGSGYAIPGVLTRVGAAQAGSLNSLTLDAGASGVDSFYLFETMTIISGTGAGQSRLITAYNGTTKVATTNFNWATTPDNTSVFAIAPAAAHVQLLVSNSITASVLAANCITSSELDATAITAIQSGLSTLTQANVRTAVGLAAANLDTQLGDLPTNAELATALAAADDAVLAAIATTDGKVDAIQGVTAKLDDTLEDDGGTYRFTSNALEEAPAGGAGASVQDIVDGVLDEALAGHNGPGTVGEAIATTLGNTDDLKTDVSDTQALIFAR